MGHVTPSGSYCFFFQSERQPTNTGQAYFYLLGVAICSYSSFQLGRFE